MYKKQRIPKPTALDLSIWESWKHGPSTTEVIELCQRVLLGGQFIMEDGRTVQLNLLSADEQPKP